MWNLQSYCNFVSHVYMLPFAHSQCLSVCLSITCVAFHPLFCSQVPVNHTGSFCLQFAYDSRFVDNISAANSLLTLHPNPQPLHVPLLTPLLPFMTVKFPFTSPSFPFLLAGDPSSNVHSDEQDQIMMDASLALDPFDFGKIRCSSTCCHNLTKIPLKCMPVIFLRVCIAFGRDLCMSIIPNSQHALTAQILSEAPPPPPPLSP